MSDEKNTGEAPPLPQQGKEIPKEYGDIIDREPNPIRQVEIAKVPMSLVETGDTSGQSAQPLIHPSGKPMGMSGQIVSTLTPVEVAHAVYRRERPCYGCAEWRLPEDEIGKMERLAALAHGQRLGIVPATDTADEFARCDAMQRWMHLTQTCPMWRQRGGGREIKGRWRRFIDRILRRKATGNKE